MSSKFSRLGTRVQPKPKVCKSPKPLPPQPPPSQPALAATYNWSLTELATFQNTSEFTSANGSPAGGDNWTITGTDDQGRTYVITISVPIGAPSSASIDITGWPPGTPALVGSGQSWSGNLPETVNIGQLLPPQMNVTGSGQMTVTLT